MGPFYPYLALAPLLGLLGNCLSHVLSSRIKPGWRQHAHLLVGFAVGLMIAIGTSAIGTPDSSLDCGALLLLNLAGYLALAYGYFAFVNLNLTSLRIRLLQELLAAPEGVARQDLLARHNSAEVVRVRIGRLRRGGQLVERDGRLHVGGRTFLMLAGAVELVRWLILGRRDAPPARSCDRYAA